MRNEWEDWLIYGGPMPDITKDWPEVPMPETVVIQGDKAVIIKKEG